MWGRLSLALHSDKSEQSENEQYLQRVNKQNEYFESAQLYQTTALNVNFKCAAILSGRITGYVRPSVRSSVRPCRTGSYLEDEKM